MEIESLVQVYNGGIIERERAETEQGAAQPVVFLAYTNMLAGKPQKQSKGKK